MLDWIIAFSGSIPGASPAECGNYSEQNLNMAQWEARRYAETLRHAGKDRLKYPEQIIGNG
jgi:S-ribosylhomocysteine lyase